MAARIWLIPLGAIAGSAVAMLGVYMQESVEQPPITAIGTFDLDSSEPITGAPIAAEGVFTASFEGHDAAAATTSVLALDRMIEELADEPASLQRDAQLQALLAQLAVLDPLGAAQLSQQLDLGDDALITVFQTWAARDPDEALFEIGALWPPATQRAVALSMLEVFGADEQGIDRVAASFAPVEALSFRIDAIGELAPHNLQAATAAADKISVSATQTIAQQLIAGVMAGIDPLSALAYAETIVIPIQRQRFMDALLDNWAKLDPAGMFAYMETADLSQMAVSANSFRALATTSPEQLLALAEKFAPAQRVQAQSAALTALTALDPLQAYNRVSSLPPSADRDNFIDTVAQQYANVPSVISTTSPGDSAVADCSISGSA
jgi:hypothetical protein